MKNSHWEVRLWIVRGLLALNLLAMAFMGYWAIEPYWQSSKYDTKADQAPPSLKLPAYDYQTWAEWPVLVEGRVKPMQTVAIETVRTITGRATFQGQPAMAMFLSWVFYDPEHPQANAIDWDNYAFILCEDHDLRASILGLKLDDPTNFSKIHGKYLTPREIYQSVQFQRMAVEIEKFRSNDQERYTQQISPELRKVENVHSRIRKYEAITGILESRDPAIAKKMMRRRYLMNDPVHFVALDKAKNSAWFSMGELKYLTTAIIAPRLSTEENISLTWQDAEFMEKRVSLQPKLYLDPDAKAALEELQSAIKAGNTDSIITGLQATLNERLEKQKPAMLEQAIKRETARLGLDKMTETDVQQIMAKTGQKFTLAELKDRVASESGDKVKQMTVLQTQKNARTVQNLKDRLQNIKKPFIAEESRHNQMYMDYLEARYPDMYNAAIRSQAVPLDAIKTMLASYDQVGQAYRTSDATKFNEASKNFFNTITTTSKQYVGDNFPGDNAIALELTLNRVEPFKWAWISMLLAMICFLISLKFDSRIFYQVAFVPMVVSLGFQIFAYYGRVMISGRPPVSNMFETVVFVSSMGAVFALGLEFFYRNTIIVLSGTVVATLGLILADQLPYSNGFDSKISPLTPVLRSNYWLIIHVMTIVASYAAGALAWAIGNISLILYWFNSDRRDLLKTLANLCYSAIKVAVLLLGVGTLLGGIWAAESWGRFWGWDPKETWALIALVVYLLPLHARYIGWVKDFGMAIASVVCFSAIVMSWYGVNFILGAGLHSYGMGDGGPWTIFFICSINLLWVLMVCHRKATRELAEALPPAVA